MELFIISCQLKPPMVFLLPMSSEEMLREVYDGIILPYKYIGSMARGVDTLDVHGVDRKMRKWMTTKSPKILRAGDDFMLRVVTP